MEGFFIWDSILLNRSGMRIVDPWVALSAIGMATQKLRIGPLVTPLARRRPWKLAREATSVDHLTNGRLILGVDLGDDVDWAFGAFGETTDAIVRAKQLDEGLGIINALWSGKPVTHTGKHYSVQNVRFLPRPFQRPRIPIWVSGFWPRRGPMRRATRDGTEHVH